MKFEGQITLENFAEANRYLVDAEPHIMKRLRKLFDGANNYYNRGKYTHKPLSFPVSLSSSRDLLWLMDRYLFDCTDEIKAAIEEKSKEYIRIQKFVSTADTDGVYRISNQALPLALPLREHQVKFNNMFNQVNRLLLADVLGLGKTPSAISTMQEPNHRPALVVVPTHLCTQWEREIAKFLPGASTHVIKGFKNYPLPDVDILITSYNRLKPWQDTLLTPQRQIATLIFDEVHDLRHTGSEKRYYAKLLSEKASRCVGLSATPIYNMGGEIWSVLDVISPGVLGSEGDFLSEWCTWEKVNEPAILNSYLKSQGLMLRRTNEEANLKVGIPSKHVITLDADMESLKKVEEVTKMLAMSILGGNVSDASESQREFDWKLRHATGVAKAKPAVEFIKMLSDSEDKIVVGVWHRDVYEILMAGLEHLKPVMYSGSESVREKDEAYKAFREGDSRVMLISLRSGAGLDGLQFVSNTMVIAELDWSGNVTDQLIGRLARDGQVKHVNAYFLTINDGADPFMIATLAEKRSQHDGLVDGKASDAAILTDAVSKDRIREMAKGYLRSIGEEIPEAVVETGLLAEISTLFRSAKIPVNTEAEMQESMHDLMKNHLHGAEVEREYKISKRSRVDFLVSKGDEKIAIECKITTTDRQSTYKQVRRYAEEIKVDGVILVAPWPEVGGFIVDQTPVVVIDTSMNAL